MNSITQSLHPVTSTKSSTTVGSVTKRHFMAWCCRGFNRTAVDKPLIFQLSQSEALQSVTAFQSLKLEKCFVTITSII